MPFRTVLVSGRQVPVVEDPEDFVVLRGHLGVACPFAHDDPRFSPSDCSDDVSIFPESPVPEMQIVINVHGGLVQEVFASEPLAEVVVVDWDVTPGDPNNVEVQVGQRHLQASVQHPMVQALRHLAGSDIEAVIDATCEREQAECFPA